MPCLLPSILLVMVSPAITGHLTSQLTRRLSLLCSVLLVALAINVYAAPSGANSWPNCIEAATVQPTAPTLDPNQQRHAHGLKISATALGCRLVFRSSATPAPAAAAGGANEAAVVELSSTSLIAGDYNGSYGRPPVVQTSQSTANDPADAVLVIPEGGMLLLQDLLLTNITLTDPQQGNPNLALLPTNFDLPTAAALKLRDVVLVVSEQQLKQYIKFMSGVSAATVLTDGASFLHIRNYTNPPFGVVEARCVTLIAPEGAKASSSNASSDSGDAAGIATVTDSYVLAATKKTLIPLMQQLAGQEDSKTPLFVSLATNMTLAPSIWGSAWPAGGLQIRRPVIWGGSSWRTTSLDFGMDVGQIRLDTQYSNMTLMNVALENLAYGDEASSADAEGNSILLSNQLWAFKYKRSVPRLVLYDVVLVLPEQKQIENVIYWVNAFNSDLPFWRSQTTFLRDTLKYTVIQYTVGKVPGEYIIIKALKKDQLMYNLTYTTTPAAAPKLALPFNASIHQQLVEGQADPVVGTILTVRGLAVAIWNQRRSACSRPHVLIPSPDPASVNSWVSLAPARLDMDGFGSTEGQNSELPALALNNPTGGATEDTVRPNTTLLEPFPQLASNSSTSAASGNGSLGDEVLPPMWPPPGGEVVRCPLTIRGPDRNNPTLIDIGFGRNMFTVERPSDQDLLNAGPQGPQGLAAAAAAANVQANSAPQGLLQLSQLTLMGLPQGAAAAKADKTIERAAAPAIGGGAGQTAAAGADAAWVSGWVSNLPAEAWTHLLWFIDRPFSSTLLVSLTDVTLMLPAPEAKQFAEAANSAYQAAAGDSARAILSVLYPTADGPLPVTYRSISMNGSAAPAAAAVGPAAASTSGGGRRLLQQQAAANQSQTGLVVEPPPATPLVHICVDSMVGLGLMGRNICFMEVQATMINTINALPPGYVWAAGSGAAKPWPAWKTAVVILAIVLPLLAAAVVAAVVIRRRKRARRQEQQQQQLVKAVEDGDAKIVLGQGGSYPPAAANGSSTAAAAAAVAGAVGTSYDHTSGSTRSHASSLAYMLGQCCPRSSADTAAGTTGSSSMAVKTPQIAAATPSAAAGLAAAAAAAAAGSNASNLSADARMSAPEGSMGGIADRQQLQYQQQPLLVNHLQQQGSLQLEATLAPTIASSICRQESSSLVVSLGEQLGQIAAIHKRSMFQPDADNHRAFNSLGATVGEGETALDQRMHALQQYQQQLQLNRGVLVISGDNQASTLQRLTNAISTVSAEMQLRKLGGVSTTASGLSPALSGASAAASIAAAIAAERTAGSTVGFSTSRKPSRTDSDRGGPMMRGSSGILPQQQQQQQQQGLRQLSLTMDGPEEPVALMGKAPASGNHADVAPAVSAHADVAQPASSQNRQPSPTGVLIHQAPGQQSAALQGPASPPAAASAPGANSSTSKSRKAVAASSSNLSSKSVGSTAKQRQQAAAAVGIQLQLHEVIGTGTFGVVYRATWRGIPAAVKVMQLSGNVVGCGGLERGISDKQSIRREQMAVMETALGSSMSHPNIVQVYTYHIRPLHSFRGSGDSNKQQQQRHISSHSISSVSEGTDDLESSGPGRKGSSSSSNASAVVGYELQLVMEYCALGSLREALDNGFLDDRLTSRPHYLTVLTLALGVARAMHHLHSEGVLHGDLKCGNVLLKMDVVGVDSGSGTAAVGGAVIQGLGRQYREQLTAKVADFGLATRLNDTETHVSGVHRGTLNHMSPELLVHGHASRASDVYAMGILLWEMATGERAFADVPKAMLGASVVRDRARPEWPGDSSSHHALAMAAAAAAGGGLLSSSACGADLVPSLAYRQLAEACWAHEPRSRPSFAEVSSVLEVLLDQEQQRMASLAAVAEARSAAQTAAAAATGYVARTSAEFAAAGGAAAAAAVPTGQAAAAADVVGAEAPAQAAAAAGGGPDKAGRASVVQAMQQMLRPQGASVQPAPAAAAAAGAEPTLAAAPPSTATFLTIADTATTLDSRAASAAAAPADQDVAQPTDDAPAAGVAPNAANSSKPPLASSNAAAAAAAATRGQQQQQPVRPLSRRSPFEMMKDQSGW